MEIQNQYEAAKVLRQIADEFGIYITSDGLDYERICASAIEVDENTDVVIHTKPQEKKSNLLIDILG